MGQNAREERVRGREEIGRERRGWERVRDREKREGNRGEDGREERERGEKRWDEERGEGEREIITHYQQQTQIETKKQPLGNNLNTKAPSPIPVDKASISLTQQ